MAFSDNTAALVVIDAQKNMLHFGQGIDPPVQAAAGNIVKLIDQTRHTQGMPIIHVAMAATPSPSALLYDQHNPHIEHLGFIAGAEPQGHEALFVKNRYSAFLHPEFARHLQQWGIKSLHIIGFHTSACVQDSAIDAVKAGLNVSVIKDATYSRTADRTDEGLEAMQKDGIRIIRIVDFKKLIWPKDPQACSPENPHCVRPNILQTGGQLMLENT